MKSKSDFSMKSRGASKNNKYLAFLSPIAIVGLLTFSIFYSDMNKQIVVPQSMNKESHIVAVQSPLATANLSSEAKTYNNEGLFTFKYPKEYTESGMGIISPLNKVRNKKDSTLQNGELKLEFYPEEFDGITTSESCWQDHSSGGGRITGKSTVKVGGKNYETILWEGEGTGEFLCIANKGYRILIMKYPAETTRQNEYVDILSSFKFTN